MGKTFLLKFFYMIYKLINPQDLGYMLRDFVLTLKTFFIFNKEKREQKKKELFHKINTMVFGCQVLLTAESIGKGFWCGGYSTATRHTVLKDHVCFNGMKITGSGNVTIGSYFHSGIECLIITQAHNYDNGTKIPYDATRVSKDVEIGDFVWFGSRVTVLPGTKIGEGAIVQAGAVVHGEIPAYAIVGGNPAKVFKYRDIEHFQKLKAEGKFF